MSSTVLKLTNFEAGMEVSADQFASADFQGPYIYERVQGRLVVMSPAGPEHRQVSRPFRLELGGYWHAHTDVVDEVDIEGWVATSADDDRIPDICVYLVAGRSHETVPQRVPEIIFEFVSQDRTDQERDYIDKRKEYYGIGVREYVIVDRFKQAVLVLTHSDLGDFEEAWLPSSGVYTSPLLPGFSVPLVEVFAAKK